LEPDRRSASVTPNSAPTRSSRPSTLSSAAGVHHVARQAHEAHRLEH
jgi:hypothetical protein